MLQHTVFQERTHLTKSGHHRLTDTFHHCARLYNAEKQHWQETYDAYKCEEQRWLIDDDEPGADDKKLLKRECSVGLYSHHKRFTEIRKTNEFWNGVGLVIGRGVLERLERAKNAFYRRCKASEEAPGYPKWRAGRRWKTIEVKNPTPGMVTRKRGKLVVKIKGMPILRIRPRRPLPPSSALKSLTITRKPNGVYASLGYEVEKEVLPPTGKVVGMDRGVTDRLTLSDGQSISRRRIGDTTELQQRISKCRKNSNTQAKLYRQLRRYKAREAVSHRNECHRITTDIIRSYDLIAIEQLEIANMVRSAKGTVERPGRNVAAKSGLNRAISEQGWSILATQLAYKAQWYGRELVEVDPKHTSQTCSRCGKVDAAARQKKKYHCGRCGLRIDADINAASNILARGLTATGGSPSPGRKTEKQRAGVSL